MQAQPRNSAMVMVAAWVVLGRLVVAVWVAVAYHALQISTPVVWSSSCVVTCRGKLPAILFYLPTVPVCPVLHHRSPPAPNSGNTTHTRAAHTHTMDTPFTSAEAAVWEAHMTRGGELYKQGDWAGAMEAWRAANAAYDAWRAHVIYDNDGATEE